MTQDLPTMNDQHPSPDSTDGTGGVLVELAQMQKLTVEFLAQLGRPPRNLRIHAGEVSIDITWDGQANSADQADKLVVSEVRSVELRSDRAELPKETGGEVGKEYLTSPGVGVFYHAREPGAEPFVSVGSLVRPGQQIGIIEAMKLMIPVEADRGGRIAEVLKGNGEPVEYAEPLFALHVAEA